MSLVNHEKIIKREDGSRIKIEVRLSFWSSPPEYSHQVFKAEKGKRTFIGCPEGHDYRSLSMEARAKYVEAFGLTLATEEEIVEAQHELHQLLEPTYVKKEAAKKAAKKAKQEAGD
jgi:hypothetical protein